MILSWPALDNPQSSGTRTRCIVPSRSSARQQGNRRKNTSWNSSWSQIVPGTQWWCRWLVWIRWKRQKLHPIPKQWQVRHEILNDDAMLGVSCWPRRTNIQLQTKWRMGCTSLGGWWKRTLCSVYKKRLLFHGTFDVQNSFSGQMELCGVILW